MNQRVERLAKLWGKLETQFKEMLNSMPEIRFMAGPLLNLLDKEQALRLIDNKRMAVLPYLREIVEILEIDDGK